MQVLRRISWRRLLLYVFLAFCSLPKSKADDWPQWGGPHRDGKSAESGLLKQFPANGPKLVWQASGLGKGYAGVSIVGERIFTMGDKEGAGFLVAASTADGKIVWSAKVGEAGAPDAPGWSYPGPRSTPTVDRELVITLDAWGELVCVTAAEGKEQWRKSFTKDFGGKPPTWGFSESPLVDGDQVVVTPGGKKGAMVAIDRKTGNLRWQSKAFTDEAHYSSIVAAEIGGVRQYIQLTAASVVGISPKDGAVLWKASRRGNVAVIPTPIVDGDEVYVTSGYGVGCNLFKITSKAGRFSADQVYANKVMVNHHGGVVKVDDYLYGYSEGKGLTCQNFQTGEAAWVVKDKIKKGSLMYAEGMLFYREEDSGTLVVVDASPKEYQERGRFKQPDRAAEKAWPHPALAAGRLYLRDQERLFCYELK